ncbi:RIP metalloprotease RseP [Fodinicurvata sp. EGI_FJ10296]|uniref:RIP metalloprotease RseP n=1 Tax=Fodinicurvata sp. EGI_FJ10296 TaxID=3231908 RepID=UPI0034514B53
MGGGFVTYIIAFLIVLSVLVFVHEWGHYWVARRNGVRIEVFSIGFGPELFGFYDRAGTRWKFSVLPLGGYVKMFGDANAASMPAAEQDGSGLSPEEQAVSFHHKRLSQRAAIVAAGPIANFMFSAIVLAVLFATSGHPFPPPTIGSVQEDSPASAAGLVPGDTISAVNGLSASRFADVSIAIRAAEGEPVLLTIQRDGETIEQSVTPELVTVTTEDGREFEIPRVGIVADSGPYSLTYSAISGVTETVSIAGMTLSALGEIVTGERGTEDLGGPIRIAQLSGDVAQVGVSALLWFMAILSINLGLINLFPVPMLDGGHLMFYAYEAVRGRPLSARAQEYGFRVGLALVLTLMVFATWNDLVNLQIFSLLRNIIS